MQYKKIKELRTKNNFTQDDMADALHISQNAYSLIENGITRLIDKERISIIAQKLGVEPVELGLFEGMGVSQNVSEKVNNFVGSNQIIYEANKELLLALKEELQKKNAQITQLMELMEAMISVARN